MRLQGVNKKTSDIVITALLFAVAIILSAVEWTLPPLLPAIPGVRLGLSNIAVMYALFFTTKSKAFGIAFLKGVFAFITKGITAGTLSLLGGVLSIGIMIFLMIAFNSNVSYLILSVFGAIFHNIGQIIGICIIYNGLFLWTYTPILIVAGIVAGTVTAILLQFVLPAVKQTDKYR